MYPAASFGTIKLLLSLPPKRKMHTSARYPVAGAASAWIRFRRPIAAVIPNDAAVQQLMRTKSLRVNLFLPDIFIHAPAPMGAPGRAVSVAPDTATTRRSNRWPPPLVAALDSFPPALLAWR